VVSLRPCSRDGIVDKDGFYKHVQRFILNPKSVTMGELYGEFNLTTQEWRPGLVAQIVHDALEDKSGSRLWVIFDGPVDALWIENMNTVLDDNKMVRNCAISAWVGLLSVPRRTPSLLRAFHYCCCSCAWPTASVSSCHRRCT